jgi:hypothetical protein
MRRIGDGFAAKPADGRALPLPMAYGWAKAACSDATESDFTVTRIGFGL